MRSLKRSVEYDEDGRRVGASTEVPETFKEKMDRTFWAGTGIASSGQNRTATEKLYEEQQVLLEQQRELAEQFSALLQGSDGLIESSRLSLRNLDAAIVSSKRPGYFRYFKPTERVATIERERQLAKLKDQIRALQKRIDRNALSAFYMRFAPNRLDKVDEVLERFAGRESELFDKLYKKYDAAGDGPDATKPDASAVGGQVNTLAQVRVEFAGCARRWWRRRQNDAPQCATMSCCSRLSRRSSTRSPSPCLTLSPSRLTASPLPLSPPAQRRRSGSTRTVGSQRAWRRGRTC